MVFEGGKFVLNKALSNHFQVAHTVNFSTGEKQAPGYRFVFIIFYVQIIELCLYFLFQTKWFC